MTFQTWKECIQSTGISRDILRLCKVKGAPGFPASGGSRINWDLLGPWLKDHQNEIEELTDISLEDLNKIKLQEDIIKTQLQNKKLKGEYLDPMDVNKFLRGIGEEQNSFVNGMFKEWPTKLADKSPGDIEKILIKAKIDLCDLYKEQLEKWIKKLNKDS
jgi:hypothetical protein